MKVKKDIAFLQTSTSFKNLKPNTILVGKGNHFIRTAIRFLVRLCQFRAINGRKILINVKLNGYIFKINIHAPNTGSKRLGFFKNLRCFITKHCLNDNILICWVFNCQLNDGKDKSVHIRKKVDKLRLTDFWGKYLA